ncbi:LysR family transcriptional regulator [Cognatiyoonia sp. IB215446]|uniref:LysR family transcriptional regulator n=1 Tax=Cognatiyoonia sp. IB215446 TaxID=3097355 RepID=UPI002A1377B3|nr:LysR family transcriptional regulator [Cognatiyoonia sp. IB215446]MDX8350641.1 LysR family transcriptional regulator [Cognatiyoonia sp. IB215446]
MIDLRLIETFIQAARRESFSGAAKALGVSPGAVSQNIKALEDRLSTRLFARTTRQVKLTPEGQRFLLRCAPAVEALGDAATALQEDHAAFRGTLRVTSTTAFGRSHVLPALTEFQTMHPELTVELSLFDGFVDLVAEEFDLAIRAGVLPDSDYIARLLLPVTPMVCASPDYLKKAGKPETLADLAEHRLVGMRSNPSQRVFAWEFEPKTGRDPIRHEVTPCVVVNDPEALALSIVHGAGIGQLGSNLALPLIREKKAVHLFPESTVQSRGIYAVYPTKRFAPTKLTSFIEHLAETLANRPDLVVQS